MQSLQPFLKSCAELQSGVNVKNIIISLIDRLATFTQKSDPATIAQVELFEVFSEQISSIIQVGNLIMKIFDEYEIFPQHKL